MQEEKFLHVVRNQMSTGFEMDLELQIPDGYIILIHGIEFWWRIDTGVSGEVIFAQVTLDPEEATIDPDDDAVIAMSNVHHEVATYGGFKNTIVDRVFFPKPFPYAHKTIRVNLGVTAGTWTYILSVAVYFTYARATPEEWIAIRRRG